MEFLISNLDVFVRRRVPRFAYIYIYFYKSVWTLLKTHDENAVKDEAILIATSDIAVEKVNCLN